MTLALAALRPIITPAQGLPPLWTPNNATLFVNQQEYPVDALTGLADGDPISTIVNISGLGSQDITGSGGSRATYETAGLDGGADYYLDGTFMQGTWATPVINRVLPNGSLSAVQVVPQGADTGLDDPESIATCDISATHILTMYWDLTDWAIRYNAEDVASGTWTPGQEPNGLGIYYHFARFESAGGGGVGRLFDTAESTTVTLGDRAAGGRSGDVKVIDFGAGLPPTLTGLIDDVERTEGYLAWMRPAFGPALLPLGFPYKSAPPRQ